MKTFSICMVFLVFSVASCSSTRSAVSERKPAADSQAVVEPLVIPVEEANPRATTITGPHLAYWNDQTDRGKLLITLGGTGSRTSDFVDLARVAVEQGYSVISVDYPNSITTVECAKSLDYNCFDTFRREINEGIDVNRLITVDFENSLQRRIDTLLALLASRDPRWQRFWDGKQVRWSEVVLVGHSQGAGHVAYLSKLHEVKRVIMLAGPVDYFKVKPANWVRRRGATPSDRYYALLHVHDSLKFTGQREVFRALCACLNSNRLIVTDRPDPDHSPHNVVKFPPYTQEWIRMLDLSSGD